MPQRIFQTIRSSGSLLQHIQHYSSYIFVDGLYILQINSTLIYLNFANSDSAQRVRYEEERTRLLHLSANSWRRTQITFP
jgi:hypothetical protein